MDLPYILQLPAFRLFFIFFLNDTATTEIYTLSLHDALPILDHQTVAGSVFLLRQVLGAGDEVLSIALDRKSTRLNSSHITISYAVFCLKKKKIVKQYHSYTPLRAQIFR